MPILNAHQVRDIERMQQLDQWPRWPVLPVKKYKEQGQMPALGVMHINHVLPNDGKPRVYECSMFDQITDETHFVEYDSLEALVADGWMID